MGVERRRVCPRLSAEAGASVHIATIVLGRVLNGAAWKKDEELCLQAEGQSDGTAGMRALPLTEAASNNVMLCEHAHQS